MSLPNLAPMAKFRPLSSAQTEPRILPRILMHHTMVGFLLSTERMFKANGYSGVESTYGLGGPWDGDALDGALWQWQGNLWQADAQFDANGWADSIETSDGGIWKPKSPAWSPKQLSKLIELDTWWFRNTGYDPVLAKTYDGYGFGYHAQFQQWNKTNHACPGALRIEQLIDVVIPAVQKNLEAPVGPDTPTGPFPKFPLRIGAAYGTTSFMGEKDGPLKLWQQQMRNRGWFIVADGIYGLQTKDTATAFQHEKGIRVTGLVNDQTWNYAWTSKIA